MFYYYVIFIRLFPSVSICSGLLMSPYFGRLINIFFFFLLKLIKIKTFLKGLRGVSGRRHRMPPCYRMREDCFLESFNKLILKN
jgi:hypothetical protein